MALFNKEPPPPKANAPRIDPATPVVAFLGPNIMVDGTLSGTEDFLIEGKLSGQIDLKSDLRVGAHARVEASVHARNVIVEGTIIGDVSAENRVELTNGSKVDGNIRAPKIIVSEGAHLTGKVDMLTTKPEETGLESRFPGPGSKKY